MKTKIYIQEFGGGRDTLRTWAGRAIRPSARFLPVSREAQVCFKCYLLPSTRTACFLFPCTFFLKSELINHLNFANHKIPKKCLAWFKPCLPLLPLQSFTACTLLGLFLPQKPKNCIFFSPSHCANRGLLLSQSAFILWTTHPCHRDKRKAETCAPYPPLVGDLGNLSTLSIPYI